jgi:hypothetical protein
VPLGCSAPWSDLVVIGDGGGTWGAWDLRPGPSPAPACTLTGTVRDAWRMYSGDPGATLATTGDPALAVAALGGRAIITQSRVRFGEHPMTTRDSSQG